MYLSPSAYVILLGGGVRPLARKLEKSPAAVSKWREYTNLAGEKGGIPRSCHKKLLALAEKLGWDLTAQDLVNGKKLTKEKSLTIKTDNNVHKSFKI